MSQLIDNQSFNASMDSIRHTSGDGTVEFWYARDIQEKLGYANWENFYGVIGKARMACESAGIDPTLHFLDVKKPMASGNNAMTERADCVLSRYACYLTAMNGQPSKKEVAYAQTYFAVQARRQELQDSASMLDKRLVLRDRVTTAFKELGDAAKDAGVQNYAFFHDAGYRGLYKTGLKGIRAKKGLGDKEHLFDRAGRAELAANEFRLTQAEERLRTSDIHCERDACLAHEQVGAQVRDAIERIGGTMPEDLPLEQSLKGLTNTKSPKKLTKDKP
jgi:DNA-damage-inducible protein D